MSLTQDLRDFYSTHGYIHVEGMFSLEECAMLRGEIHALAESLPVEDWVVVVLQFKSDAT